MEESESRRERLKAMRIEASQPKVNPETTIATSSGILLNPFAQNDASQPLVQENPGIAPRFDYYTNPLASFIGNSRKVQKQYQSSPSNNLKSPVVMSQPHQASVLGSRNPEISPSYQNHVPQFFPDSRMSQSPMPYQGPIPLRGPVEIPWNTSAHLPVQEYPQAWNAPAHSPGHASSNLPSYGTGFQRSNYGLRGTPRPNYYRGDSLSPNYYPGGSPSSTYFHGSTPRSNFGQGGSPRPNFEQEINPRPNFGRMGSHNSSKGRGCGRGPGQGSGSSDTAVSYYNKSMIEDPWRFLVPVVRVVQSKSWLPQSLQKEAKLAETAAKLKSPEAGVSLAEYLAVSVEEASKDVAEDP